MNDDVFSAARARSGAAGRFGLNLSCAAALALMTACGGGGDDTPAQPMATSLTGTAATGAALAGATLLVTDQTGATVCDTTTDALGTFQCTLPPGTPRPLVLRAAKEETVLYSATATTGDVRANVTPLTTIIAARLAPDGNPATLSTTVRTTPQAVTADTLRTQSDALIAALQPLLTALGITIDPLAGPLVADGTGQDKVLDAIAVTVRPDGTASNIEITVKTMPTTANPDPVSIQFRSNVATVPPLPLTVATADLSAIPTPAVVASLMSRLTACFALPLSQRVNAPNDTTSVVGAASDVIAPACRTLFVNDDPTTYLSGGSRVGRNASNAGSFSGLFRAGARGVVFSDGNFEYFRSNGDMIVSAKWIDPQGNTANETYVVRNVGGVLKLIGNQYAYSSAVRPYAEDRELVNSPQFSYYSTGYNIRVDNRTDSSGNPIFSKVLVTTPLGTTLTLLPAAGQSLLAIAPNNTTPSGTSVLRLAAGYRDTAMTADHPSLKEPTLVYASPLRTDDEISTLQDRSLWTFEFFHADSSQANVVQSNRTLARPYTVSEIRLRPFAQITASARADLIAESVPGYAIFTSPDTAQLGEAANPAWTVPTGALAPTSVSVLGRAPFGSTTAGVSGNRFDDFASISSTARFATVFCSPQTVNDLHCAGNGQYAVNTTINMIELWGVGINQVEISKKAGLFRLQ
jgi:hypothetical protein